MMIDIQEDYDLSFTTLQDLRHLEQKVIPLRASFQANLETIQVLETTNKEFRDAGFYNEGGTVEQTNCLRIWASQLRGHLLSTKILEKRIQGVLSLVGQPATHQFRIVVAILRILLFTACKCIKPQEPSNFSRYKPALAKLDP